MGNKISTTKEVEKSVYDILEINSDATESEIKKQYSKLLMKYHPDTGREKNLVRTREIISAYKKLRDQDFKPVLIDMFQVPDFKRYTREYFQGLVEDKFYSAVNQVYEVILRNERRYNEKIKLPVFGNKDTKMTHGSLFYVFFKSFKTSVRFEMTQNGATVYDRDFDKEKAKMYNESVRNLTKAVMCADPRLKRNIFESVMRKTVEVRVVKKKMRIKKEVEKYSFYCDACNKGFMSENTMVNHIKGLKHKNRIKELGMEEKTIEEIISEKRVNFVADDGTSEEEQTIDNEEIIEEKVIDENINNFGEGIDEVEKKIKNIKIRNNKLKIPKKRKPLPGKESFQLLTCSHCKLVFESRNKLFDHIRSTHN